jgi:hypothetical protein
MQRIFSIGVFPSPFLLSDLFNFASLGDCFCAAQWFAVQECDATMMNKEFLLGHNSS